MGIKYEKSMFLLNFEEFNIVEKFEEFRVGDRRTTFWTRFRRSTRFRRTAGLAQLIREPAKRGSRVNQLWRAVGGSGSAQSGRTTYERGGA